MLFQEYVKVWKEAGGDNDSVNSNLGQEWFKQKSLMIDRKKSKKIRLNPLFKLAASIVLFLAGALVINHYYFNQKVVVADNTLVSLQLPEGSTIDLNKSSRIKYNKEFKNGSRVVQLDGEAYFSVAKDTARPFIVETSFIEVEVKGTEFNVNEDESGFYTEVMVTHGNVYVRARSTDGAGVFLRKGESVKIYHNEKTLGKKDYFDKNDIAWKTGELKFQNNKLSYVAEKLSNAYNMPVSILTPEIKMCRLTSTFKNQSIESVLTVISATLNIDYEIDNNEISLKGKRCD